jgi:caffeoyl-CoA O-methyltransferase
MEFLPPEIDEYAALHTEPENELLKKINRETWAKVLMPRMLSGQMQGRILAMFSKMIKPKNILEIGTYTGYSALCFAEGLQKDGKLITIDINEELQDRVQGYFNESGYGNNIQYMIGNALDIIPTLSETFDLVFIDADKINYLNYYKLIFDKVNAGGYIIADNVLWSGKVVNNTKIDADTQALLDFNLTVHQDPRVENVLFPVRDGLMVLRKK